ncbi:hypothetical protein CTI12_AA570390 [Artemisia annua]|uniref:Uncharacterized protein n=1 Tax=Artemisia annua TaxID=35608 RepID=A0A2U1KSB5_ARTAN|nr:hypothetical protein CTI12_AA570390 [Artemisia annua]
MKYEKGVLHLIDDVSSHPHTNENIVLDVATGPSDIPPNLGPFENVLELPDGGIIGGNSVVSELPSKQSLTSACENDYKVAQVSHWLAIKKKVEEVTNSLRQTDGMLAMVQAMNIHNSIFKDLTRAREPEANLSKKFYVPE